MVLTEQPSILYQVYINRVKYGDPQVSKQLAESIVSNTPTIPHQLIEIRQITSDGKQVLFG